MSDTAAHAHVHRDDEGAKIGMWLFLFTEILLFGGMFVLYGLYRWQFPEAFLQASHKLDLTMGTINTVVLLASSLTVVLAISALQMKKTGLAKLLLAITILFAAVFLVNKYFEWSHKFDVGLYLGSEKMMGLDKGTQLFYGLYYMMTGLHAVHIVFGMIVLGWALALIHSGNIHSTYYSKLENAGLYWHLVDVIWIFLFPFFYLI